MDIKIQDIVTFDNDERFVVVSKATYENNVYYYLINENNFEDIKFCVEVPGENALDEVLDADMLENALFPLFVESSKPAIEQILENNSSDANL